MLVKHLYLLPPLKISAKKMNELNFNENCSIMPKIVYLHYPLCSVHGSPFTKHLPYLTVNSPCAHRLFSIQLSFSMIILYLGHFLKKKISCFTDQIFCNIGEKNVISIQPFLVLLPPNEFLSIIKKIRKCPFVV